MQNNGKDLLSSSKDEDTFNIKDGDLKCINWKLQDHQRVVAAILVQAVYVLHNDEVASKSNPSEPRRLAQKWWDSLGFEKIQELQEGNGSNIFGAIFKQARPIGSELGHAPAYVIAFRGTSDLRDFRLDAIFMFDSLEKTDRLVIANRRVREFITSSEFVSRPKGSKLWLAGHSLGASVATATAMGLVEKELVPLGAFETFLFNPPFPKTLVGSNHPDSRLGIALKKLENVVADLLHSLGIMATGVDNRKVLYNWLPNLYVNPGDVISLGFIAYFKEKENEDAKRPGMLLGLQGSNGTSMGLYRKKSEAKSLYFLPSARLIINKGGPVNSSSSGLSNIKLVEAHKLKQWWEWKLDLQYEERLHGAKAQVGAVPRHG